ncbi:uncharacterized protein EV422DRAFT_597228 [Fimicolochytrium jonesii]|uniref:uncharacterized protein n=1 Tax=Fimicolochytrium jonesii TaxID=1396493 RepID=UPI0022FEFC18|nr:uncharacterized protein EV422DRAFT_597228 [Fimicolochytrium jonesii]KAI8820221.1 hypothetical protein EV422DRAFT_597228 [Fimicolochytrium jonesii]
MALEDASPSAIERVDVSSSMYLDNLAALAVASGLRAENLRVSVDSSSGWSSQVSPASLAVGSVKREAETPFARTSSSSESIEDEVSGVERSPTPRKTRPSSPHRPHICRECKKGFTTSGHVARHMRIHTGVKPYPCLLPDCQARFSRQDNMMQHYRTHLLKLQKSTASTTGFVVELKNLKSLADKGVKQAEKPSSSVSTRSKRKRQTVKSKVNSQPTAPRKARAKPVQGGSDQSGRSPEGSQSGYPSLTEHVRPIMDMTPPPSARKTRSSGREENSRGVDTPVQMSSRRKTAKRARKARE